MNATPVIVERIFDASAEKIWVAISKKNKMKEWYFDLAAFKAEAGFEFQFSGEGKDGEKYLHLCTVQEAVINKKLSYTWQYDGFEGNSLVSFELFAEGDQTKVIITHTGLETFPATNNAFAKANFLEGWTHILHISLKEYLEK